jgi:hypothetical protein
MNKKAQTSEKTELTVPVTISVPGSTGIKQQTDDDWPSCWTVDKNN